MKLDVISTLPYIFQIFYYKHYFYNKKNVDFRDLKFS